MWKIRNLDKQLFMGAAAKIHEFLDIEQLMSPGKLSLSKQLGRPLMGKLIHEAVYIEEVKTLDCEVHGYYVCTNYVFRRNLSRRKDKTDKSPWHREPIRDLPPVSIRTSSRGNNSLIVKVSISQNPQRHLKSFYQFSMPSHSVMSEFKFMASAPEVKA